MKKKIKGFSQRRVEGRLVVSLHHSADPAKDPDTPEGAIWRSKVTENMEDDVVARELDISYTSLQGRPVYPMFDKQKHVSRTIVPNRYLPLARIWDFGFRRPAVGIMQWSIEKAVYVFKEIHGENCELAEFAENVLDACNQEYPNVLYNWHDYCDVAGVQHSDKSKETSVEILRRVFRKRNLPCRLKYKAYRMDEAITITRTLINQGRLTVSVACPVLIAGLDYAYCFGKNKKSGALNETPMKDGVHDHIVDDLHIFVVNTANLNEIMGMTAEQGFVSKKRSVQKRFYDPVFGGV